MNRKTISLKNKIMRALWKIFYIGLFRITPAPLHFWRIFLLRIFGANIGKNCTVYPSVKIWAPWNLKMDDNSCLSHMVDCYSVDKVHLHKNSTVSQYSHLCTASRDFNNPSMPLITAPIIIGEGAWVAADAYIGPGVFVGNGSIVGARSSVYKNIGDFEIVGGNPSKKIGIRHFTK